GTSGQSADGQTFSRFQPRRLPAEVLLDGISQVLEVSTPFPGLPAGTRAIDLPDENVPLNFLDVFGRPGRRTACECERVDAPALTQGLELVNSAELQRKLTDPAGYATRAAGSAASAVELADELFVRVLARPARPEERQAAVAVLETPGDRAESVRSLLWALLATNEFRFNH
ncbi:MAG: S-layer protein, partial [Planctomycetaceae bacterium]